MNTATVVTMTKERAAEILYEAFKITMVSEGEKLGEEERNLLIKDIREVFPGISISDEETVALVDFLMSDINQAIDQA